jgi:hypothetical protein
LINHQGEFTIQVALDENLIPRITAVQFSGPESFTLADTRKDFIEASEPYLDESAVQLLHSFNQQNSGRRIDKRMESLVAEVVDISDP